YLSVEKLAQYRVNLHSIYYEGVTPNYIELWESYATEAVRLYDNALNGINYFDEEVRYIIELAAIAYHEILVEVRRANYTLHKKVYVSKLKKMKIYRELSAKYNRSETL
ncbi:squalene/phytoene synthase family protein, partial [Staphylococcus arlettae]